ncbi:hypothetical protein PHLGIDRAFT_113606 [Phlebiopsis gigantea 11061_1 CR5-6]|uniref:Uncharacterized protein n=1 Tax=Phlebiopsis gigantea (strain 11061_1 CR5-6) TaxID=745531 RepID=A0A0C3P3L3_PHLG1|nr:hypothetical protein PHLGIDRAFT_113606 [Phlebiopsis gigantea 11061_1 CR5-6]
MLHHAARRADLAFTPLSSILQAAASRAWVRTRPVRTFHRSIPAREGVAGSASEARDGESSKGRGARRRPQRTSAAAPRHVEAAWHMPSYVEELLGSIEDAEGGARSSCHVHDPESMSNNQETSVPTAEDHVHASVAESGSTSGHDLAGVERSHDDPPWDEVVESMQNAGDPLPIVTYVRPSLPAEFRAPTSREEMYRSLVYLSKPSVTGNTRPHTYLQRYHDGYPALQSTRSYNFLIGLAIGGGELDTAAHLLQSMYRHDLPDDLETQVLRVRLMVRQGLWGEAWEAQVARGPVPLLVWLEFFGSLKYSGRRVMDAAALQEYLLERGPPPPRQAGSSLQDLEDPFPSTQPPPQATLPEDAGGVQDFSDGDLGVEAPSSGSRPASSPMSAAAVREPSSAKWNADGLWFGRQRAEGDRWRRPVRLPPPSLSSELGRYETLMRNFPTLTAKETASMPPRVTETLVKFFVRTGNRAGAFDATKAHVANLPARLSPGDVAACLRMIHPQLVPAREGLTGYFKARKTLEQLLGLHADLRPDATTLVYLLNALRTTARCGTLALALVGEFRRRHGEAVVDERVRWRLAWLALKQRQQAEGLAREFGAPRPPAGLPARPAFHEVFAARGLEQYWTPLRERLHRVMAQTRATKDTTR